MRRRSIVPLVATAILAPLVAAKAEEERNVVRVALLDMSSVFPTGFGPGSRGRGPMGWGFGPQGGGAGWHGGPGMMGGYGDGPGMMGGYGGGPGMMGGMMSIRVDHNDVQAGSVRFEVTNWSRSILHEMLVIPVDHPGAALPYDAQSGRVPENQVRVLGETEGLQPNASKTLDVTLAPGAYLLVCNVPGHYAAGMVTPLTVTR